jgi:alpha-D-xyloside xylohydrolase
MFCHPFLLTDVDAEQNIQNELFIDIAYKSMEEIHGEGNFYIFARSVFDRSRSKTAIWDGDTNSSWESLRISVLSAIRSGLIGFSQWGSDTGGYVRPGTAPNDELWARWMMFSAFSPMYEIQIGRGKSPWYPPYGNTTMHNLKVSTDLHTRLFPFLRSYAKVASKSGVPVLRALFLEYPNDPKVDVIGDQYAFGEEFLVAPIVGAGGSRNVYFPAGGRYLEWFNKTTVYQGGQNVTVYANLDEIPAFVREGSIVPTGDIHQGNAKWIEDWKPHIEIEVFPGYHVKHSSFHYYGNDGKTSRITVKTDAEKKRVTIEHDGFDVPATFLVYGKNAEDGPLRLDARKTEITLKNFAPLFD